MTNQGQQDGRFDTVAAAGWLLSRGKKGISPIVDVANHDPLASIVKGCRLTLVRRRLSVVILWPGREETGRAFYLTEKQ